jgi:hypothetical protein
MPTRLFRYFVYSVVLAFVFMGCENPTEAGSSPISISFEPQFIIENNSSSAKSASLRKAHHYNDAWDIIAGLATGSPVNVEIPPGEDGALETWASASANIDYKSILSFVLTIDDKHYVGWGPATSNGDLEGILEYDLGYVNVIPGEINQRNSEPVLLSKLTPKLVETRLDRYVVVAVYGVRITDEGVSFVLYKQTVIR